MFHKILIANRGEIACRVIRTARRLGIATVAVYSDGGAGALHVELADEAWPIGPAPARESYLRDRRDPRRGAPLRRRGDPSRLRLPVGERRLRRGLRRRGHRLHRPAGRGDPRHGLEGRGQDADGARRRAAGAGLSRRGAGPCHAARPRPRASAIPVLIKASAGGGGKGMRIVERSRATSRRRSGAKREAAASFGDDRVLIERYLTRPRHIEIQVFADTHGNVVSLFERDCSIQRRHQKVIEEAPAPGMDPARRRGDGRGRRRRRARGRLRRRRHGGVHRRGRRVLLHGDEHAAAGRASGHRNDHRAGPGRVAAARRRGRAAAAAPGAASASRGHAIEARVYAEDPARDFLPSIGTLLHLRQPARPGRMCASIPACAQGDAITPYYDPMIAKLIVWGEDRDRRGAAPGRRAGAVRGGRACRPISACCAPSPRIPRSRGRRSTPASSRRHADVLLADAAPADAEPADAARSEATCTDDPGRGGAGRAGRPRGGARGRGGRPRRPWSPWNVADAWRMNGDGYQDLVLRPGGRIGRGARPSADGRHLSARSARGPRPRRGGRGRRSRHDAAPRRRAAPAARGARTTTR